MRWPKRANKWGLPQSLQQLLQSFSSSIVHVFAGLGLLVGLVVGSLIAISITSGMLAITIILLLNKKAGLPLIPMFIALGVEGLILVVSVVMAWLFSGAPWMPY